MVPGAVLSGQQSNQYQGVTKLLFSDLTSLTVLPSFHFHVFMIILIDQK